MAETTVNQTTEIPSDYQAVFTQKLDELKHINQNLERNSEKLIGCTPKRAKRLTASKNFYWI